MSERTDFGVAVTLCVKADHQRQAEDEVLHRLNQWFSSPPLTPPFPNGTLLHFTVHNNREAIQ